MSDPHRQLIIEQHELDKLEQCRLELHELAKRHPEIQQTMLTITSTMWPIIWVSRDEV